MATGIVKSGATKVGGAVKNTAQKASSAARNTTDKAQAAIKDIHGPSPNPMTNLIIADIALRGGGRLAKQLVERAVLGAKYNPERAKQIVDGRSMTQTLLGTAIARIATRSVPGALLVGAGLLAKTIYDRSKNRHKAVAEGERALTEQAKKA